MSRKSFNRLLKNPAGAIAFGIVMLYLAIAVGVEIYDIYCEAHHIVPVYEISSASQTHLPPGKTHWLGTDYQGRDVFFRALAGCATAVKVGVISGIIAIVIGVTMGAVAGYRGGFADDSVVWTYSVFAAMPSLLFILAFALLVSRGFLPPAAEKAVAAVAKALRVEPGMLAVYAAIGLTGWVTLSRVVRVETMKLKNLPFVEAAKVAGVSNTVIIIRHILPNVSHLVIIFFTLTFAGAVMSEVIVSYLGFGVQNFPSWGVMISDGQEKLWRGVYWEIAGATGFMFILVLALNILGDALRDIFDPRESR